MEIFFNSLYSFDFKKADSCVQNSKINDVYKEFLKLNLNWWKLITSDNQQYITECFVNIYNGFNKIEKTSLSQNEKTFFLESFGAYKLRLFIYNNQLLRAYNQAKSLNKQVNTCHHVNSQYPLFGLIEGLYNYFFAIGKSKYPLLFPEKNYKSASKNNGINYLKESTQSNDIFKSTEASYFLMKLYLEIEAAPKEALTYSAKLVKKFENNLIYQYYHLDALMMLKKGHEAKVQYFKMISMIKTDNNISNEQREHIKKITNKLYLKRR